MNEVDIAVLPGDGIGPEVTAAARAALERLDRRHRLRLRLTEHPIGAALHRETGTDLPAATLAAARDADAVLLGAVGLPDVRHADGTEITPHLRLRTELGLLVGIRPVRRYPQTPSPLADGRADQLDLVVVREGTQGLFASRGRGLVVADTAATETLVVTRATTERLVDHAFALARRRREAGRGPGRVTCVDKADVFAAMAFFRRIFDERAAHHPDVEAEHLYVDAAALELVRRPARFDVLVMESMFGDILSDLAGGLVGGVGMAPSAELGDAHGLFQPAHGSAPDIAGRDLANPTAMLLATVMLLDRLAERRAEPRFAEAARGLDEAVTAVYATRHALPVELGGDAGCRRFTHAVLDRLGGG
jgi:3-isopropylmalate dehydrogenase